MAYILSFVVYKIKTFILCTLCSDALESEETTSTHILRKNRGGLIKPSLDVSKMIFMLPVPRTRSSYLNLTEKLHRLYVIITRFVRSAMVLLDDIRVRPFLCHCLGCTPTGRLPFVLHNRSMVNNQRPLIGNIDQDHVSRKTLLLVTHCRVKLLLKITYLSH